jgi:hypothetical protein
MDRLLCSAVERRWQSVAISGEDEQEQRPVIVQRDTPDHAARLAVDYVDVFVTRPIAWGLERRHSVAELHLKLPLRPECELTNI